MRQTDKGLRVFLYGWDRGILSLSFWRFLRRADELDLFWQFVFCQICNESAVFDFRFDPERCPPFIITQPDL